MCSFVNLYILLSIEKFQFGLYNVLVRIRQKKNNILKHLNKKDYIITLEIEGTKLSSKELANKIDQTFISNPNISFIIGGSDGIDEEIKQLSNFKLSFSNLTFPHQLFRLILLEQIYRSFKINNNETYHK